MLAYQQVTHKNKIFMSSESYQEFSKIFRKNTERERADFYWAGGCYIYTIESQSVWKGAATYGSTGNTNGIYLLAGWLEYGKYEGKVYIMRK